MDKEPFDIDSALRRVESAGAPFPKAGMFALAEEGYTTVFEQLVACILSIRTLDEVMVPTVRRFFARARTPAEVAALSVVGIDAMILKCTFHEAKAAQIHAIAERAVAEFGGEIPGDEATLLSLRGVGPKCAHLVLGIACGQPYIGVDIHVHRVTNRWGYVAAPNPEATMAALEKTLPQPYWIAINRLLVPFAKFLQGQPDTRCPIRIFSFSK